ncbi:hypothetical protein M408DRAFT_11760 [Serendipita vermifera MAFF 305830]|uniref:Uncharacterized protein n=1 Tax=Serendipita vermifera MAFF 305830 TaxID=933852 RepID=A0A0C3AEB8_SERVB|nr:hypothetical protein M408DRAFT_11760 [Serendipita vermifera MAFF 305830]
MLGPPDPFSRPLHSASTSSSVVIYLPSMLCKYLSIFASFACSSSALLIKRDAASEWADMAHSLSAVNPSDIDLGCPTKCSIWNAVETIATNYPMVSYDFCSTSAKDAFTGCRDCLKSSHGHPQENYEDDLQSAQHFIENDGKCGIFNCINTSKANVEATNSAKTVPGFSCS